MSIKPSGSCGWKSTYYGYQTKVLAEININEINWDFRRNRLCKLCNRDIVKCCV